MTSMEEANNKGRRSKKQCSAKFKHEALTASCNALQERKKKFEQSKSPPSLAIYPVPATCTITATQLHCQAMSEHPAKATRQSNQRFPKPSTDSSAWVASSGFYGFASDTDVFLATWEMFSKLAIANGGLLRAPCNLRSKTTPSR